MVPLSLTVAIIVACFIRECVIFNNLPSDNFDEGYKKAVNEMIDTWNATVKDENAVRLMKIKGKIGDMKSVYSKR
jgi:hypothetical protein